MTRPIDGATSANSIATCGPVCFLDDIIQKISAFVSGIFNSISALFLSLFFCCTQSVSFAAAAPATPPNELLLPFYRGEGPNSSGVTLEQILSWDDSRLEAQHHFIQWLFPLTTPSRYNSNSPVLDPTLQRALREDRVVQRNFFRAYHRILRFYGFRQETTGAILPTDNFAIRSADWATPGNHNLLRITRILTSMRLMGHSGRAIDFSYSLQNHLSFNESTIQIWNNASYPRE